MRRLSFILVVWAAVTGTLIAASPHPARGRNGMVATAEPLATAVGVEVMKAGGNAVDATVAIGFALAVTFPQAGNLGGGGFSVVRTGDGQVFAIDYREKAPAGAHRDMYLKGDGEPDDELSREGYMAAGVPGTVAGLFALHEKLGRLPMSKLIEPAIALARNGFPVTYGLNESLQEESALLGKFPETRLLVLKGGSFYKEGEMLRQPELAATLAEISAHGASAFYEGRIAKAIVAAMQDGRGLITAEDLRGYKPVWREPVRLTYRGHEMYSMPPPSSGGVILAQVLNMIEKQDVAAMGFHSAKSIHAIVEAMRRSYRDRAELLGDPDFIKIEVATLISKEYAARLSATIDPAKATPSGQVRSIGYESAETTHYCVVDREGNAVATTYTLNGSYGCGRMVAGFLLNNEMDDFSAKPGHPNMYGLVGSEANAIQPGKRMLSSMTPTIVVKDGRVEGIVGSPGGSTIPTTVIQVLTNVIDFGMNIQEAVDAPRYHHQYLPDQIRLEPECVSEDGLALLRAMGHAIDQRDGTWGNAQAIWWNEEEKHWNGASDSRQWGLAAGH